MTKSENSITTGSSSKASSKTTKTINTSSTTMNDTLVEQIQLINFIFKTLKITNENFHKWYSDLKLFLDSEELGDYISKNIKDINTNKKTFKIWQYMPNLMINELKERFSETGPSRLFEIEMKIKKLEIENDDFKAAKLQNKAELSEETKVLYSLEELNKIGIAYSFTFLYVEKTFKDLKRRHNKTKDHN
ncbi:hypothetical protein H8356DRAFT_1418355 [Neocallimastix lanati (nom. inval.)]|nr:hypothetical protein H8356DRAFT_1418355 [Neocallimastix sp. JGI-2020a]